MKSNMLPRNNKMADEYVAGKTATVICQENGIGLRQFYHLMKEMNVKVERNNRRNFDRKILCKTHQRVGLLLYDHYFKKGMTRKFASQKLGVSLLRLRSIEQGQADISLMELLEISNFTGLSVGELVKDG